MPDNQFYIAHRLFAQLLYGTGMRISEGLQLRVKDLDFDHGTIIVREGKGSKDGVLGIFRPKTTKCSGGRAVRGLQRGITFR